MSPPNYDLAIFHVTIGQDGQRLLRLTRKGKSGRVGHRLVYEFEDWGAVNDFIEQMREAATEAFGASEEDNNG